MGYLFTQEHLITYFVSFNSRLELILDFAGEYANLAVAGEYATSEITI